MKVVLRVAVLLVALYEVTFIATATWLLGVDGVLYWITR